MEHRVSFDQTQYVHKGSATTSDVLPEFVVITKWEDFREIISFWNPPPRNNLSAIYDDEP